MKSYKMIKTYTVRVNGRAFQKTESESRRDELLDLLPGFYPGAVITVETKRERKYI